MKNKFIWLIVFFKLTVFAYADTLYINSKTTSYSIHKHIEYFEDKRNNYTIEQLTNSPHQWIKHTGKSATLNFGFTKSAYWLRFSLHNCDTQAIRLLLSIGYPLIDKISFYEINNNILSKKIHTGDILPFNTRELYNRHFIFNLIIKPNTTYTYYIYANNNGQTLRLPLSLNTYKNFFKTEYKNLLLSGIFYGILIFILLFNIFLYITIRDKIYIHYFFYVLFLSMFLLNIDGFSFQFFWQSFPWWANHSVILFVSLANVFLITFSKHFLNETHSSKFNKLKFILLIVCIVMAILALSSQALLLFSTKAINVLSLFCIIIVFISASVAYKQGFKPASYFLASVFLLTAGVLLYVFRNLGVLPNNLLTIYGVKIGFVSQVLLLSFAVSDRFRKIKEMVTARLEGLVRERTLEIELQKEEISHKAKLLTEAHKDITDSITYAKRIQDAILPDVQDVKQCFSEMFILYIPKSIVSGDFYWFAQKNNLVFVAAADCTGHGVPGAFMSLIGNTLLNEIINKKNITTPHLVLEELRNGIINSLKQHSDPASMKDGMDIALCCIDKNVYLLEYAGAFNPLFIILDSPLNIPDIYIKSSIFHNKNYLYEIAPTRCSIGVSYSNTKFTTKTIQLSKGNAIYLCSDGYIDQFGGSNDEKFKYSRFKKLIIENQHLSFKEQHELLINTFNRWKGSNEQIDDILIVGIKL